MRHFNFETNIERRSPFTGNVFMVARMTSEYAERWPFNVDAFIMDVAQRHHADVERVRVFFNYGLGKMGEKFSTHCPAKHRDKVKKDPKTGIGDLILGKFPDYVNGCEPALIEAWNKGAEYHTRGFRQGDTLPDRLPSCRITRLEEGGWIALFPKEMHLLEKSTLPKIDDVEPESNDYDAFTMMTHEPQELSLLDADDDRNTADAATEAHDGSEPSLRAPETETEGEEATDPNATAGLYHGAPLPCGLTEEQEATEMIASAASDHGVAPEPDTEGTGTSAPSADDGTARMEPVPAVPRSQREILAERRHQRRLERERMQRSYEERMEREAREAEQAARDEERRKIFAAVGAVTVTAVMIYFFGLLGPAVFGLLCGGLLKG